MSVWTEPVRARLTELLADPEISYTRIAVTLSREFRIKLTKNACIGYARRIGLPRRQVRDGRPVPRKQPALPRRRTPAGEIKFMQLRNGDCRWVTSDGAPWLFCGEPQLAGQSYCLGHCRIAYPALGRR